jgi:hypothetical protein
MSHPGFSAAAGIRMKGSRQLGWLQSRDFGVPDVVVLQGCDFWDWMSCAGTIAGCAISCVYKGAECFECFAKAGREVCYACV